MPSASSKNGNVIPPINVPDLLQEPIKNVVCVLDKKVRNLEKRKIKLVETKRKAEEGSELNEDQKKALENLILVDNSLATVKEVHKSLTTLELEYLKLLKRDQKRVKQEQKEQFETRCQEAVWRTIQIQSLLSELNEDVRPDFLNATNGACLLTDTELGHLDAFYELISISPENKTTNLSTHIQEVSCHLFNVIEAREKEVLDNLTYKQLNEILTRIQVSGYFEKELVGDEPDIAENFKEEINEKVVLDENNELAETQSSEAENVIEQYPLSDEQSNSGSCLDKENEIMNHFDASSIHMDTVNGVDLPPEVQQMQQSPDNEKIDFMGESEISPAMLESQQLSLNPVSPEFIPRNMQPLIDEGNGWEEQGCVSNQSSEWTESQTEGDWQAVPELNHNQNVGFRGRMNRGNSRTFGRGRGRGGNINGGFRGSRQDGGCYRGNRSRGGRGEGNRGPRGGSRNSSGRIGRVGNGNGLSNLSNRSSAPQ